MATEDTIKKWCQLKNEKGREKFWHTLSIEEKDELAKGLIQKFLREHSFRTADQIANYFLGHRNEGYIAITPITIAGLLVEMEEENLVRRVEYAKETYIVWDVKEP